LAATALGLPAREQSTGELDALVGRPAGWLATHAGIKTRRLWAGEDALDYAARAGCDCLAQARVRLGDVTALLVTSEAPPLPIGLAAALHHRLGLAAEVPALEVGGACCGFLTALWLARRLLVPESAALIVAVEAPSRWLSTQPGPAGEAAALCGDGAAACLLAGHAAGERPLALRDLYFHSDGDQGNLLRVERDGAGAFQINMQGPALAQRAVRAMTEAVRRVCHYQGVDVAQLARVVIHAGNGRMPPLVARSLALPAASFCSVTGFVGNLGSASLPAA
jgi:3-oxoacyl-[acyl-carrier-protein] synthase III